MTSQSAPIWVKSGRCDTNTCVEAAVIDGMIALRNSQQPDGPIVTFSHEEWQAFLGGVQDGDFQFS